MESQLSGSATDQSKAQVAEHIALEASRLARIASEQELGLLAHLIDMVVLEAWREATESGPIDAESPGEDEGGV